MTENKSSKPRTNSSRSSSGKRDFRKRKPFQEAAIPRTLVQPRSGDAHAQPTLVLSEGREKSLQRRHPWIFSGAIDHVDGAPANGQTVAVRSADGEFLAWAAYNAGSQISARVWSWREDEVIDAEFFRRKVANALAARDTLSLANDSSGMRIIHAESDGLPGLIVDQYGEVLVMQIGSAGAEFWRDTLADILQTLCKPTCIYERSDSDSRGLEGLAERNGVLRGTLPETVEVVEHGLRFKVDVKEGQKTGFYLDQRDNRKLTETLARGKTVLNCFCYTGGFSLYALRGGAKSVLSIDASAGALHIAAENLSANGLDANAAEWQCDDVFLALRKLRDQGRKFDFIILDPPKCLCNRPRRKSRARLQRHQPAGLQIAQPRRPARHLFLLRRHQRRVVPEDHRRRGTRCRSGRADRALPARQCRSSGVAELSRGGVLEGVGVEGCLAGVVLSGVARQLITFFCVARRK
jgi:23S rRNA (cytosine1962-C5)-methyltransferase